MLKISGRPYVATAASTASMQEVRREAVGKSPRQYSARRPVQDRKEIQEPAAHRDIRDIGAPDLIRAINGEVSQKVRIHGMLGVGLGAFLLAIERFNTHQAH